MASNNPWANSPSQGNPHSQHTTSHPHQGSAQAYYQSQPEQVSQQPTQGVRRSDTDQLLAQQTDRAEQVEHMQQYESHAPQNEDDRNQAQLQKEFPNIDGSLIAAIYNERKGAGSLGEVRELLQELNTT